MNPVFPLSKLQNPGSGTDACGTPMPVPSRPEPVIHFYTTSKSERDALIAATYGNCFKYDDVEGQSLLQIWADCGNFSGSTTPPWTRGYSSRVRA